jgi:lipopolysaccharide biosynthesis protein
MICWANESWKKAWGEKNNEILIRQDYSYEDDLNHIKYLIPFFKDPRYIRVNGKPVLCIYRSTELPDIDKTIEIWRNEAKKEKLELYICRFESFGETGEKYLSNGIDAAVEFHPHNIEEYYKHEKNKRYIRKIINKVYRSIRGYNLFQKNVDYKKYVQFQLNRIFPSYKYYPCVTPMWDNSPRRQHDYFAFYNSTPKMFGIWLKNAIEKFVPYSDEENFIFINAWNEWAEGNHLEPDMKWGSGYLKEIKKIYI